PGTLLFINAPVPDPVLHSFPTRRSSDLAHQAEAHERRLDRATHSPPARQRSEQRDHERLAHDVQRAAVVEERSEGELHFLSENRPGQGDDHDVKEREPYQESMSRPPHAFGKGSAGGHQGPQTVQDGSGTSLAEASSHEANQSKRNALC